MKKILLMCILVLNLTFFMGCSNHKHKYGEWVIDEEGHYLPLICDKCNQPTVMEPHKDLNNDNKCDECGYDLNIVIHEHTWSWHIEDEIGHIKTFVCGCPSEEDITPHFDFTKDGLCDDCGYEIGENHPYEWRITEDFHSIIPLCGCCETPTVEEPHKDDDYNLVCDICNYRINAENRFTIFTDDSGDLMFYFSFNQGDNYKFEDNNIYVNETLVFSIENSCKHHYYEYYINTDKITEGIYEDFISEITVKTIPIDYEVKVNNITPYAESWMYLTINCLNVKEYIDKVTAGTLETYKYVGLFSDINFTNEITNVLDILDLEDKNVYKKWEVIPFNVTFDLNSDITDGVLADFENSPNEVTYETRVLPVPSIPGFEFIGWYNGTKRITDNKGQLFRDVWIREDLILKAKWVRTEYYFSVKQTFIDDIATNVLEIGKGPNSIERVIPENAISNNVLAVSFIEDVMEELYEDALFAQNIYADYYNPGHHLLFFTSTYNDINTREHWINLEEIESGFYLCPYYESNEYLLQIYDGDEFINVTIDYETALNNYILFKPIFDKSIEKEGHIMLYAETLGGKHILSLYNKLSSDGLELLELIANKNHIEIIATFSTI